MKKTLALGLGLSLTISLLVSCSKKEDAPAKTADESTKKPARKPAVREVKEKKPTGKTVAVAARQPATRPGTTAPARSTEPARPTESARNNPRPVVASTAGTGRKVLLRLRFRKGKVYKLAMVTDQKITQTVMGRNQVIDQTMGFGFSFNALKVAANGTATVKVTYFSVKYRMRGPMGMSVFYDSSKPSSGSLPVMARPYAALKGQSFTMEVTRKGKVLAVTGVDAIITHMVSKLGIPPGPKRAQVEATIRRQFGDQTVREMMENMMAIYPENKVGVGAVWSKTLVLKTGFPSIITTRYTLKALKKNVAVINATSVVKPNLKAGPVSMGQMKMRYNLRGKQSGDMEMELASGLTTKARIVQKLAGKVTMSGHPKLPAGLTMDMKISSVIKFKPVP
jgi:hypothetical protein